MRRYERLCDDVHPLSTSGLDRTISKYGITVDQYVELWRKQEGRCAVCRRPARQGSRLFVDHDHSCCSSAPDYRNPACGHCVRGLLCPSCNRAIGILCDRPELMRAAADYVERSHEAREMRTDARAVALIEEWVAELAIEPSTMTEALEVEHELSSEIL